jgi:membrane protein
MRLPLIPPNLLAATLRLYRRTEQAELDLISAGVAFYGFLAIFPAIAAVIAIWGVVFDPTVIRTQMDLLKGFLPPEALLLVSTQVDTLLLAPQNSLRWATVFSTLFALWSARAGVAALIRGLNAVHHLPNRAGHYHQLRAVVITLALVGLAMSAMMVAVIGPLLIEALPLDLDLVLTLHRMNLALGLVLVVAAVGLAYHFGPNRLGPRPPFLSLGLLVAVVLWALAARGFVLYLANFPAYNRIYGSIGAVVALLFWLYVSSYAVLLGAAVDAERQAIRRKAITQRADLPQ